MCLKKFHFCANCYCSSNGFILAQGSAECDCVVLAVNTNVLMGVKENLEVCLEHSPGPLCGSGKYSHALTFLFKAFGVHDDPIMELIKN